MLCKKWICKFLFSSRHRCCNKAGLSLLPLSRIIDLLSPYHRGARISSSAFRLVMPCFFFFLFFYSSSFFLFLSFNLSTTAPPAALSSSIPPSHPPSSSPTSALSKLSLLCGGHAGDRSPSAPAAPPLKVTSPSRLCRRFVGCGASISGIRRTHPPPPTPLLSHPGLPLLCLFFRVCVCVTKHGRFPPEAKATPRLPRSARMQRMLTSASRTGQ